MSECPQIDQPQLRTLQAVARETMFKVVDRAEQDLKVKDKLLEHTYSIQILPVADLPQHNRDTGSARFLER